MEFSEMKKNLIVLVLFVILAPEFCEPVSVLNCVNGNSFNVEDPKYRSSVIWIPIADTPGPILWRPVSRLLAIEFRC